MPEITARRWRAVMAEAFLQLRGEAGACQVPGIPEVGAVSSGGGPIAGWMLLTKLG